MSINSLNLPSIFDEIFLFLDFSASVDADIKFESLTRRAYSCKNTWKLWANTCFEHDSWTMKVVYFLDGYLKNTFYSIMDILSW